MNFNEKTQLRALATSSNPDEPLALMNCGELSLLVSSKDIVTLMPTQKIIAPTLAQACGELEFEQNTIPVFSFNKALQLQAELPSNQLTLVVLKYQARLFALCCSSLEKIEICDLQLFTVPISMSSRKQPFTQFAVVNNCAAGLTSAQNLSRLLDVRGVVFPTESVELRRIQEAS